MNILAYIMSTIALVLYCGSYFFNNKKKYLIHKKITDIFMKNCNENIAIMMRVWYNYNC